MILISASQPSPHTYYEFGFIFLQLDFNFVLKNRNCLKKLLFCEKTICNSSKINFGANPDG